MAQGAAFVDSVSKPLRYVGYASKLTVNVSAGTVLLDATADIDGVSLIVPWRVATEAPKARYDNLEIVHVPQHTTQRLNKYLATAAHQRAYVNWMVETIKQHVAPDEKALVICKKYCLTQSACLIGLTVTSASRTRRATPSASSGTLRAVSSAPSTGAPALAATIGKTLTWCCCLMSSFCPAAPPSHHPRLQGTQGR